MSDEDDIQWSWGDDERDMPEDKQKRRNLEQKIAIIVIVISALIMMYSFLAVALTEMSMEELMGLEDRVIETTK